MPSRKSRSRSRTPHKRHKKSHKKSKRSKSKSRNSASPASPLNSLKFDEKSNSNDSNNGNGIYKPKLPSVMLPPSFLAKLEPKDEPKKSETNEPSPVVETSTPSSTITPVVVTSGQSERKRKSRWIGDENEKVFLPNMPTTISMTAMTEEQRKIYLLKLQIEELTRRLKINDLGIPARVEDRSPSPEPIYDQQGKRQNTREVRTRKKLEEQRHQLVTELLLIDPEYKAPGDYKPQQVKVIEKVMIPQEDHPDVNFVGLIIGPRGSTLKMLEKETGAKIIIRGKGSVKDGKMGLVRHGPMPGEDEPLHAYITGTTQEMVSKAGEKVQEIINKSIDAPEGLNELRKQQLRQLALLNGTLRENEPLMKMKLMEEAEKIVTNTIVCLICGGAGHVQADCKFRRNPDGTFVDPSVDSSFLINSNPHEKQKLDCEYQSFKNELSGNKDAESALSLDDRRNLLSGTKLSGPTLAIAAGGQPSSTTSMDIKPGTLGLGSSSFNIDGTRHQDYDQTKFSSNFNSFSRNGSTDSGANNNVSMSSASTNYSSTTTFGNTGPRYNNNDVFDGYHLLRRHTRPTNYSSYIEGDSYRAQHIPALLEGGDVNVNQKNSSTSSYSRQSYYPNQSWNSYNSSSYYQSAYQQQYFQSGSASFAPPLPKGPPPPPPPPL